jgi:hypothetical protein
MSLTDHAPCRFVSCAICGPALAAKPSPAQEAVLNEDISWMTREDLVGHYQGAMMNWSGTLDERDQAQKELAVEREAHATTRANYEQAYASQIAQRAEAEKCFYVEHEARQRAESKLRAEALEHGTTLGALFREREAHASTREQRDTAERCFARLTTDFDVTRESLRIDRERMDALMSALPKCEHDGCDERATVKDEWLYSWCDKHPRPHLGRTVEMRTALAVRAIQRARAEGKK